MSTVKNKKNSLAVELLAEYCKGCGLCVSVCREDKIEIDPTPNERGIQPARIVSGIRCTGCLRCTAICPEAAIEIDRVVVREPYAKNKD